MSKEKSMGFNNPLNIKITEGVRFKYSEKDVDSSYPFYHFSSVDACVRAWLIIMNTYSTKRNIVDVKSAINRYCPDSSACSYYAFVKAFFATAQLDVTQFFTMRKPLFAYTLCSAMCKFETGYQLSYSDFDAGYSLFLDYYESNR